MKKVISIRPLTEKVLQWVYVFVAVAFVCSAYKALYTFGWEVLAFDQWRIYDGYFRTPFPANILALQNGHRPVFPGLLFLADIYFFGAHNQFLTLVGAVLSSLTAAVISLFILRDRELPSFMRVLSVSFVWIITFWLANIRVLGHGNESVHAYMVTAALVLAAWCVVRTNELIQLQTPAKAARLLLLACFFCAIASFSFGPGIVTWLAIILVALMLRFPPRLVAPFGVGLAVCLTLYLFVLPGHDGVRSVIGFKPLSQAIITCVWLGAPAFYIAEGLGSENNEFNLLLSGVFGGGAIVFVSLLFLRRLLRPRRLSRLESLALAVVAFGVGTAVVLAVARTAYFVQFPGQVVARRYLAWPSLFWAGFLVLLGLYAHRVKGGRKVATTAWILLVLALPAVFLPAHKTSGLWYRAANLKLNNVALGLVVGVRDDARVRPYLYEEPQTVYRVANVLRARRLSMFSWEVADLMGAPFEDRYRLVPGDSKPTRGAVDGITPIEVEGGQAARFRGWGFEIRSKRVPRYVVTVDEEGTICGIGRFTGRHRAGAIALGLDPKEPIRFHGYIRDFRQGHTYRFYAVLRDAISAAELPVNMR